MPALSNFGPAVTFAENAVNAAPALLDADVTFTSATSLVGGRLVVSGLLAEDRISILDQGFGAGQISVFGGNVFFGLTLLGTFEGGVGGTFTVTFAAGATEAGVDALIQRLAYQTTADAPVAGRNLTIDVIDGTGTGLAQESDLGPLVALTGAANPFDGLDAGTGSTPAFVDLDGDGDFDLVSGSSSGTLLAWRNTGTAQTPAFTPLTGSDNPFAGIGVGEWSAPAFVDLDGDGDLDLVTGESYGTLEVWRNTGTASAPVFTALRFGDNPLGAIDFGFSSTPAFADLDGDGDFDLVVGEEFGELLDRRNMGTASTPVFPAFIGSDDLLPRLDAGDTSAPAFVDLDGDGDLDLVAGNLDGTLLAWRNTGTAAVPVFTALAGSDNPFNGIDVGERSTPAFVDLDGDGNIDLVVGRADGTFLAWRNPSPLPTLAVTVTPEQDGPPSITSAATASVAENETGVVYQATATDPDGTSSFTWTLGGADAERFTVDASGAVRFATPPDFERPADAGGDNVYDITLTANDGAADSASRAVAITVTNVIDSPALTGLASSVTFAENAVNAGPQLLDASVIFTAETALAGGRLVIAGLLAEDRVSVLAEGNGAGQIGVSGSNVLFGGVVIGSAAGGVGDTFTVTFTAAATAAAVDALIQRLAYQNISDAPTASRTLTLDVIDGDGRGLAAEAGIGPLTALTGAPNPFDTIDAGDFSTPAFVDLDGDGDLDLVSGRLDGTLLAWRNTGTASAPAFSALAGSDNPFDGLDAGRASAPAFVDLDGDGDLDLVSGEDNGSLLAWRNTGTASAPVFSALSGAENPFDRILVAYASTPAFVDLDGDGDLDLVSGDLYGALSAWRNTGTAASPAFTALTGSDNPFDGIDVGLLGAPAFVDLDGDGDLDLVVGENDGSLLAWRNTGTASAPAFSALTGAANPFDGIDVGRSSTPAFLDLDGDGDLDLVVGEEGGTLLAWRNTAPPPPPPPGITVTVTAEQDGAPVITSGTTASFAENGVGVAYQATATDPDLPAGVIWSLGGADAARFTIDAAGAVRFATAPDFEARADVGRNNVYDITVIASDGTLSTSKAVAITLTDVPEPLYLVGGAANDLLRGTGLDDTLIGAGGDDTLEGGPGRDLMEGGAGNDTYLVDTIGDLVSEQPGEGFDRIRASISIFGLQDEIERLDLIGTADLDAEGNEAANLIRGNAGRNRILGAGGDDTLVGDAGADSLAGGAGNDSYFVDSTADLLFESPGEGFDLVVASVDWTLGAEFEWLSLTGTADLSGTGSAQADIVWGNAGANRLDGAAGDDTLAGRDGADTLIGGDGADRLDGGAGADSMAGGAGDDTYVVDAAGDRLTEAPGGGNDRVLATVDWTLDAAFERLTLLGTADLAGTGNAEANRLDGNAGQNRLDGGDGADSLFGGAGADTLLGGEGADRLDGGLDADRLEGGAGADLFVFGSAAAADGDLVADFAAAQGDRLILTLIDADTTLAGNQAFAWIGDKAFAGVAGQLRFDAGVLEGDTDGDAVAEFRIALTGVATLAPGAIWL